MAGNERQLDDRAAVDKALSILTAFGDDAHTGLGVSELARRSDLSKSTTHRILALLERNGAVERDGVAYRLGSTIRQLAQPAVSPLHAVLRDLLTPHLADLYQLTQQTVHLAVLQGADVTYLNKLHGHRSIPSPERIGRTIPAYCTAVGKAMLAFDPAGTDLAMRGRFPQWTPMTISSTAALERELSEVRRAGVAYDRGEHVRGVHCVAVPLLGSSGRPIAALSVACPEGVDPAAFENDVRRVAFTARRTLLGSAAVTRLTGDARARDATRAPIVA